MTEYDLQSDCGIYVGSPKAGKTTLALKHGGELIELTRRPMLILDSRKIPMFSKQYHEACLEDVIECVWKDGNHCYYSPKSKEEMHTLCDIIYEGKNVIVFIDEVFVWLDAHSPSDKGLLQLMRGHQHARCHVLATTQHFSGDISQAARSCSPHFYVFKCTSTAALKALRDDFALNPEEIRALPQFQYRHCFSGFSANSLDKPVTGS